MANKQNLALNKDEHYKQWLTELKQQFKHTQLKASVQVNSQLLQYYWQLGAQIVERQQQSNWGNGFLKQLSQYLMAKFPSIKGFSLRNLKYIRQWFMFWIDTNAIGLQAVAQLCACMNTILKLTFSPLITIIRRNTPAKPLQVCSNCAGFLFLAPYYFQVKPHSKLNHSNFSYLVVSQ